MSGPRVTFKEKDFHRITKFRFYEDRIEREWDVAIRRGKEVYPTANINEWIGEQTTYAYGLGGPLKTVATCMVIAVVLDHAFEHLVLHVFAFGFYGIATLAALVAITKMKKDTWLYVNQRDGRTLFCVREKGLDGISRERFVKEIQRYAKDG